MARVGGLMPCWDIKRPAHKKAYYQQSWYQYLQESHKYLFEGSKVPKGCLDNFKEIPRAQAQQNVQSEFSPGIILAVTCVLSLVFGLPIIGRYLGSWSRIYGLVKRRIH